MQLIDDTIIDMSMDLIDAVVQLRRALACAAQATFTGELTMRHASILRELRESGPTAQICLARAIAVDPSLLMHMLDDLEKRALVKRQRSESDRRLMMVSLTAKGRRALGPLDDVRQQLVNSVEGVLSSKERTTFIALSVRICESLKAGITISEPSEARSGHR